MASSDAARARWMKRAIFFSSFFSTNCSGSKFFTSPAIRHANLTRSSSLKTPVFNASVMRVTPFLPASRLCHTSSVVLPTAQIRPRPVTTTLRPKLLATFRVFPDVVDRVLHSANLFRVLIRDFNLERFLECHYQFHRIQGVSSQVIHKRSAGSHFALIHSQLLDNDLLHFFDNIFLAFSHQHASSFRISKGNI